MQSFNDFEIVLVDDHSTDNSFEIANQYFLDHKLAGICVKKDLSAYQKGVSGARNQGIDQSNGHWICFLDSDDLFHPDKLNLLFFNINLHCGQNIKAIYHTPFDFIDGENVVFSESSIKETVVLCEDILPKMLKKNLVYTSAVTMHRDIFLDFKFDYDLHGIEDYYLWLNVSKVTSWMHLSTPLTAYRIRTTSLMGGRKFEYYIIQNSNLIHKLKHNKNFTFNEIKLVEKYLMVDIMNYYASISINNYGWIDFFKGNILLILKGYFKTGTSLFLTHSKFAIMGFLVKNLKK